MSWRKTSEEVKVQSKERQDGGGSATRVDKEGRSRNDGNNGQERRKKCKQRKTKKRNGQRLRVLSYSSTD